MDALERRHLANLRFSEVTRALRAVSAAYVERRHAGAPRDPLDSAGKRAAFALFYAPLHFITVTHVLRQLEPTSSAIEHVVDLGCGTGVAGAAWALTCNGTPSILGVDRHPWATAEAMWTYAQLGLRGRARAGQLPLRLPVGRNEALVAAYVLNELPAARRTSLEDQLAEVGARGTRVLVLEPIAHGAAPWWDATAERLRAAGFRADTWRFDIERPAIVAKLDTSSGLDHRTVTVRTLYRG